jgi:flavin reductase (DIM6/NTAB) family NADH-FMN oxidoreductase RutF
MTVKSQIRKLLLGEKPIPQYVGVGLHEPQMQIRVWLYGEGDPIEVTRNNVTAALRPFMIGIVERERGKEKGETASHPSTLLSVTQRGNPRLVFQQWGGKEKILGEIFLRQVQAIDTGDGMIRLFEVTGHRNYCLPPLKMQLHYLWRWWQGRKQTGGYNFQMATGDLYAYYVFTICPRPVVLVSVVHEESSNIFPMDLIGPTNSPYFLMALRSTSPAVALMKASRRIVLSGCPFSYQSIAYDLGAHHRKERIEWDALSFPVHPSPTFGIPMPDAAVFVREVAVEATHEIGSHCLFVTRIANEERYSEEPQLFHIAGYYHDWLERHPTP